MTSEQPHPQRCLHSKMCVWNKGRPGECLDTDCASHRYVYASHNSATELEESEQWRRVYENGYTDGQQAEREQVIQQFIDFGMSGKCVKTDKAVSCDAICEHDCIVCFAESLRGGATQQGGAER